MVISDRHGVSQAAPSSLILLHGNYASPRWWEPVRQHLPGDMTVLIPDMRGWVESGRTTINGLAVKAVVQHLLAFLDERAGSAPEPASATSGRWPWRMLHLLRTGINRLNAWREE